jgi:hypothetical protein
MRLLGYGTLISLVSLGLVACTGDQGPPGEPGPLGPPGNQGPPGTAITTGTLAGRVTDGIAGNPLAGVKVTAADAGGGKLGDATTGGDGRFSVVVTAGAVDLTLTREFYTSPGTLHTGATLGQTTNLAITMNEAASGRPSVALAVPGDDVGFGATIALTATAGDPNGDALTYAWSNATAPVLGTVTGSGAAGSLTMPTMAAAFAFRPDPTNPGQFISGYRIPDRFGIIPILTDTRGQMTASVTVSDGRGQSATASLTVNAASVQGGTRNVPVGQRIYVNSGHDAASAWTLVAPEGSPAALDDPTTRAPSFVVDRAGSYTVTEGSNAMTIIAGTWRGMIAGGSGNSVTPDGMCMTCHGNQFGNGMVVPDMFTPWLGTGHATMFTRGINGVVSDHYSGACIGCHTVGYDPGVAANGFDEAAATMGWNMPTMTGTNWDNLVAAAPSVARLGNIQCESCHGPQDSAAHTRTWDADHQSQTFLSPRIAYAAENCATCHAAGAHHLYSEWTTTDATGMGHSNRAAISFAAPASGLNASCGRCHTAQGYTLYAGALAKGQVALDSKNPVLATVTPANAEPVTCVACHDPHDASNPNQLRFYGDTPNLPSGFAGHGMGKGALCLTCHNSRNGAQTGSLALTYLHEDGEAYNSGNPTGYSAPHQADQGDVFTGHNAYFLGATLPMISKHAAVQDTCVGCHMTLQPKGYLSHGAPARSGHLFRIEDADRQALCASCHGSAVDGAGIQGQVEGQLAALAAKMGSAVKAKVNGFAGGLVRVRAWDPATDLYSSSSTTSLSNLVLDVVANPVTTVDVEEIHGQVGFVLHFAIPITVPFVDAAGNPAPSKAMTSFGVQMGAIKDTAATPAALYLLSGNLVRAGWNYFLVEGDQSKGLHNPSFVTAVLNTTLAKDLSN